MIDTSPNRANSTPDPASITAPKASVFVWVFLASAVVAGGISAAGWFVEPRLFAFSYVIALTFVISMGVGSLAWLMILHVAGAVWSQVVRRLLENLTRPLAWNLLLFIPLAMNLSRLYVWADSSQRTTDPELMRKAIWLNPPLFDARSAFYLAAWSILAGLLCRGSTRQDTTGNHELIGRMRRTSMWGLILLGLTTSFFSFDWIMSLDPHWSSTIFGVYFWAGSLVGSLAALILLTLGLRASGKLDGLVTIEHMHELGKLLIGFVIFWAYIAFCQYLLIWYANFPEETRWYVIRRSGNWNELSWSLLFGHFVTPFFLLLPRANKRDPFWLGFIAILIIVFHYADLYWLVMPTLNTESFKPHWLDLSVAASLISFYCAIVAHACRTRPPVPIGDSRLTEALAFENP
jgi:hypothetical protein